MDIATQAPRVEDIEPLRVVLYSHDSVGLGHQRRNLAIAHGLSRQLPALLGRSVTGLLLTGVERLVGHLPSGFDAVRLPGITKGGSGYAPRGVTVPMRDLIDVRRQILGATLGAFVPDLVIIDRHAFGVDEELLAPLRRLRAERPGVRVVLGLREVLDEPAAARREWARVGTGRVRELFDAVWVYGDEGVTDVRETGELPGELHDLVEHTGYLATGRPTRDFLRGPARPYLLTMVGGGHDGDALCRTAAAAPVPEGRRHLIVTGPQMSGATRREVELAAGERTEVVEEVPEGLLAIQGAEAVACMGGYNTVCEVLSTDRPALVVPREHPRREQVIRADALAALGAIETARAETLTSRQLGQWFAGAVERTVDRTAIARDGLDRIALAAARIVTTEEVSRAVS